MFCGVRERLSSPNTPFPLGFSLVNEGKLAQEMGVFVSRTLAPLRSAEKKNGFVNAVVIGVSVEKVENSLLVQMVTETATGLFKTSIPVDTLTVKGLRELVARFLAQVGTKLVFNKKVVKIFLVGFDTPALLACITDHRTIQVEQRGDVHVGDVIVEHENRRWDLRLRQVTGYFPNLEIEEVAGQLGLGTVAEMERQFATRMPLANAANLATRLWPAFVAASAVSKLRSSIQTRWGLDLLRHRSLASLAAAVFKKHFLRSGPAPWRRKKVIKKRSTRNGIRDERRREVFFAGNRDVRIASGRSYWGGQMEAYGRGLIVKPMVELDAVSLYPTAALLQPLPNQRTRWTRLTDDTDLNDYEGFVHVEFSFPASFPYPNLPVTQDGVERLVLAKEGESHCTVAEVRLAKVFGATVRVIDGWGFRPNQAEREHDVGRYMRAFLTQKKASAKNSVEYVISKLFLNALVGKLVERWKTTTLLDLEYQAQAHGLAPGIGVAVTSSPTLRRSLKSASDAGSLFAPEWASLILGRARSVMADIAANGALYLSTDAVLVPKTADVRCDGLDELERVGGGLRADYECDAAIILRSRFYALLKRPASLKPTDKVWAQDESWAVVKVARHGSKETKAEFAESILASIGAGRDMAPVRRRHRRLTAEASARKGVPINTLVVEEHRTKFNWDFKRRLVDRDINPFTAWTPADPYTTISAMQGAERQHRVRAGEGRRQRRHQPEQLAHARDLLRQGVSVRDVARETKIPRSTVADLRQRLTDEGQ